MRRLLVSLGLLWLPLSTLAQTLPAFSERMATRETLAELRKGGYVLYMRHGYTNNARPDRYPTVDLNDCQTQRVLSNEGRQLMRDVGAALRKAGIPISEIVVSPMCRTRESARLVFGERTDSRFILAEPLMYSANMTSDEKKPRLEALREWLQRPLATGSNRLLLAHAPNLHDLIGFFVKPEGTLVVFAQHGPSGYEYVASIPPALWPELLK